MGRAAAEMLFYSWIPSRTPPAISQRPAGSKASSRTVWRSYLTADISLRSEELVEEPSTASHSDDGLRILDCQLTKALWGRLRDRLAIFMAGAVLLVSPPSRPCSRTCGRPLHWLEYLLASIGAKPGAVWDQSQPRPRLALIRPAAQVCLVGQTQRE
jgi:hypothetical protein